MSRRVIDMVASALVLIGLGYVVAVSARTLPGQDGREPLLEVDFTIPTFLSTAFIWLVLAMAAFGATFLLLSITKSAPRRRPSLRRYLGLLVWLGLLYLVYTVAEPGTDGLISEVTSQTADGGETGFADVEGGAAWVVSILLVGVIAAALTKVGLSIRSHDWTVERQDLAVDEVGPQAGLAPPLVPELGIDPSSRVIRAYADFEEGTRTAGQGRRTAETPQRHARRAQSIFGLPPDDVTALSRLYAAARFGHDEISQSEAEDAVDAWHRLRGRFT